MRLDDGVRRLVQADELLVRHRGRRHEPIAVWDGAGWPSHGVGLRNAGGAPVRIVAAGSERPIGDVDRGRAPEQVHPGASYLHQGEHWRVVELDLDAGVATVEPDDGATYTVARSDTHTRLLEVDAERSVGAARLFLGCAEVEHRVVGYQRKETLTGALVATRAARPAPGHARHPSHLVRHRRSPSSTRRAIDRAALPAALHAIEHAAIGILPLFAICDRWDVGGVSIARHADTGAAHHRDLRRHARRRRRGRARLRGRRPPPRTPPSRASRPVVCREGCPSCVQSPKCGNGNEHLDKPAAVALLHAILDT